MNVEEARRLAHPRAVMIQTTSRCNAACVMCPHPQIVKSMPQGDMSDELFARLLDEIATFPKLQRVMLYLMNEPLLDPQIVPRIERARAALPDVELYIISNGIALTERRSDELLNAGLTWIGFSLHAVRPDTYKAISGRGDFTRVRDNIIHHVKKSLLRHGDDSVMVNLTRIRPFVSDEEWNEAISFWRHLGLKRLDLVDGYISRAGNVDVYGHEPLDHPGILGCRTVWAYEMAHVLFDGSVIPCCMDYRRQAVWGNAADEGLLAVWQSAARREFLDCMDGRALPDDFLCRHCEDAIPAAAVEREDKTSTADALGVFLLVFPPPWLTDSPPLGPAALLAWLEREGLSVSVYDANIELFHRVAPTLRETWEWEKGLVWEDAAQVDELFGDALRQMAAEIAAHPAPVVGLHLASRKEIAAALLAGEINRLAPHKTIVAGGPGAATSDERTRFYLRSEGTVKHFIVGEGELTLTETLRALRGHEPLDKIPGLATFAAGRETFSPRRETVDMAELPVPAYTHFDVTRYRHPALAVEWSRGCTGDCAFCNVHQFWHAYRRKPSAVALAELAALRERFGVDWFSLVDPVINGRPDELEAVCDGIIANDWRLKWSAGISPNHPLTAAQFAKLAQAGCYRLEFGVESGSDRVLRSMNKRFTVERAGEMCRDAHAAGIEVVLYLIVGFPGETEEDFAATLAAMDRFAPHVSRVRSVNSLLLIPGSAVCEEPDRYGLTAPDRTAPGWMRRWRAGDSTPAVRAARIARLEAKLRELGVPVEFSNRDELLGESQDLDEKLHRLFQRVDRFDDRLHALNARARRVLAEMGEDAPGAGEVALTICPVWGVDAPPYGLASLTATIEQAGYRPLVRDFNIECYRRVRADLQRFWEEDSFRHWTDLADWERLAPHLQSEMQFVADELLASGRRVLGFSVYSPNRRFTIEVLKKIKQADPTRVTIVGGRGVQTTEERLLFPPDAVDYFVVGEGEQTMRELLAAIFAQREATVLPGVVRFDGHHLTPLAPRELIDDLAALPHPTFNGFSLHQYRTNELPILASRGCTGHCTFCNDHPAMGRFRPRPGRRVAEEMLAHAQRLGVRRFRFNDQLINGDLAMLDQMCDALIAADARVEWIALAAPRGDMPDELLPKMRRAGCYTLNIGVESGSDAVLKKMAKGYRTDDIERALHQIRAAGINTMINFIVGFPGESDDEFAHTLAFVRRNREHICGVTSINTCLLLLGSPLAAHREQLGITVPPGADADTGWETADNNPAVRQDRARRLLALLHELELPICVSNLHEKTADVAALAAKKDDAGCAPPDRRIGGGGQKKSLPYYESIEKRDVDVLLIMPPVWGANVVPLGIGYIQHYLQKQGFTAQSFDLNTHMFNRTADPDLWRMEAYKHWTQEPEFSVTLQKLADLIDHYVAQIANHPAKILGFSLNTGSFPFARMFAKRMKDARPERPIVFGGPGVTNSLDIHMLTPDEVDYIVLGEGERSARKLVENLLRGRDEPLDGVIKIGTPIDYENLTRPIQEDLEEIGWPTLDDFNLAEYQTDAVPILGSRGCIRRCTFCNDHHIYRKYRQRAPESIAEEMRWHADRGRLHFTFHDVLINGHVPTLVRLCEMLIADGRRFRWGGQGVIRKEMTRDVFVKLKQAGCMSFVFGVESFSNKVLRLMNKPYTHDEAEAVLTACHEAGVETIINIIVGFPGETEADFRETYEFIRTHKDIIDQVASISPCLINLGSRLFNLRDDYGIRFPDSEQSIKWFSDDGNNFEERRRRVLALTTLLARLDQSVHTINLYDEDRNNLPQVEIDTFPRPVDEAPCDESAALSVAATPDIMLVLPPPWGVDFPPLGLAALAGALRHAGLNAVVRDLNIEWYDDAAEALREYWSLEHLKFWASDGRFDEIVAYFAPQIDAFIADAVKHQPKAVGFSTNESNLPLAVLLGEKIKQRLPATTIVLGGPGVHWPADRERIGGKAADLFVVGEGEASLVELLHAADNGEDPAQVPGVVAWRNGQWIGGGERPLHKQLDDLPAPDYSDLPLHRYRTNQFPLILGRGCINRCAFCNDHRMVPGYRAHSPARVLAEVQRLKKLYGAFAFSFNDLLVNADLTRLREFCRLIVEHNERIAWTGQALVRTDMTADDFKLLKRAGCVTLVFGVESFSDDVLKRMGKRFVAADAATVLRRAKDVGLQVMINLIVGFPGESEESFAQTCEFLREHHRLIDKVSAASTCIVVAQCELEKDPARFGIVLPKPEHWRQWYSADEANTYEKRVARLHRLVDLLDELRIDHSMTNLYREALEGDA